MREVDEMDLIDLAVERPEFESCLGHMAVTWQEDPTEPIELWWLWSILSTQAPPVALIL